MSSVNINDKIKSVHALSVNTVYEPKYAIDNNPDRHWAIGPQHAGNGYRVGYSIRFLELTDINKIEIIISEEYQIPERIDVYASLRDVYVGQTTWTVDALEDTYLVKSIQPNNRHIIISFTRQNIQNLHLQIVPSQYGYISINEICLYNETASETIKDDVKNIILNNNLIQKYIIPFEREE